MIIYQKKTIPSIPGAPTLSPRWNVLSCQRLEDPWSSLIVASLAVVLQADIFLTVEWLAALWSSASQLFGLGLLHNYIKAWSTARPRRTSYKYDDNPSLRSPHCLHPARLILFLFLYKHSEGSTGPISPPDLTALSVTCCIHMHVGVSGFEHRWSIFTKGWSVARFSVFPWASLWCSLASLLRVLCVNAIEILTVCEHLDIYSDDSCPNQIFFSHYCLETDLSLSHTASESSVRTPIAVLLLMLTQIATLVSSLHTHIKRETSILRKLRLFLDCLNDESL